MRTQRVLQAVCGVLFLGLVALAAWPACRGLPTGMALPLDPSVPLAQGLASRSVPPGLLVTGGVLLLTLVLGRFFCGHVCPLGSAIDLADRFGPRARVANRPWLKVGVLAGLVVAAILGLSGTFLVSPLVLAYRSAALVVVPILDLVLRGGVALTPSWMGLTYAPVPDLRFDFGWVSVGALALVLGLAGFAPRAWCRFLCPAGAIFALFAYRPLFRRQVGSACDDCGVCRARCPTSAIGVDPRQTNHAECIACQACVHGCPHGGIHFGRGEPFKIDAYSGDRRAVLVGGVGGLGFALISRIGISRPGIPGQPGTVSPPGVLRPPGAMPEPDFLVRCTQCGACLASCPTNGLQPCGLVLGFEALYTPRFVPRAGACVPGCNACGAACPTHAILPLSPEEKARARVGTARVNPSTCLAWADGRKCSVCREFCPYDAIRLVAKPGRLGRVPVVDAAKCNGCGLCEYNCPVQGTCGIGVEPEGAVRGAPGVNVKTIEWQAPNEDVPQGGTR